jgi:polyhydroxyalkanoate synthesis regulator phasin
MSHSSNSNSNTTWNVRFANKNSSCPAADAAALNKDKFTPEELEKKMKKIRSKKRALNNPKAIPLFEDVYGPSSSAVKEGFGNQVEPSSGETLDQYLQNYKATVANDERNTGTELENSSSKNTITIGSLTDEINTIWNDIGQLTSGQLSFYDEGVNYSPGNDSGVLQQSIADQSKDASQKIAKAMKNAVKSLSLIMKFIFFQISSYLRLFFKSIQLIMLNFNSYVQASAIKMASALTGNPNEYYQDPSGNAGGIFELKIFKQQIQSFLILLMVWIFLYNWYYVMFFLQPEERFNLHISTIPYFNRNAGEMKANMLDAEKRGFPSFATPFIPTQYTMLYGLIGPALRVPEMINWLIVDCIGSNIQQWTYGSDAGKKLANKQVIPNYMLFLFMAFIIIILVSAGVPNVIMIDFFNSFSFSSAVGYSIISIISLMIVFGYGIILLFKFWIANFYPLMKSGSFVAIGISILCILITGIAYGYYLFSFCVPMGVIAVSTYFFLYTFLAIVLYNGVNIGTVLRQISNSVFKMTDILDANNLDVCKDPNAISWTWRSTFMNGRWWLGRPYALFKWVWKLWLYALSFLFEIIMIVMLLGGINIYRRNYQTVLFKKATTTSVGSLGKAAVNQVGDSIKSSLKQLFTWLIMINVILIVLFFIAIRWKYRSITELIESFQNSELGLGFTSNIPVSLVNPGSINNTSADGFSQDLFQESRNTRQKYSDETPEDTERFEEMGARRMSPREKEAVDRHIQEMMKQYNRQKAQHGQVNESYSSEETVLKEPGIKTNYTTEAKVSKEHNPVNENNGDGENMPNPKV